MHQTKNKTNMVWIDMEMTGLDPEKERIIEIATLITDKDLNLLGEGPNLVIHQDAKVLDGMDEWNQKHHKKSGLLDQVKNSQMTVKKAERLTLGFIKKFCLPKKSPLCGNAVHHDRRFLMKYMPSLSHYLHYRHVDVSTLKILIHGWYPQDKKKFPKKSDAHRASDDIRRSIEELRFYQKNYFIQQ
ncbi:MAG: oligoribonuclease [Chlamydiae bacterium]|nr:oligoribonuclease [Chlamydiota bacterium]MBI3277130.1 oligoribonuclease [Chlamydiota bacterium]